MTAYQGRRPHRRKCTVVDRYVRSMGGIKHRHTQRRRSTRGTYVAGSTDVENVLRGTYPLCNTVKALLLLLSDQGQNHARRAPRVVL